MPSIINSNLWVLYNLKSNRFSNSILNGTEQKIKIKTNEREKEEEKKSCSWVVSHSTVRYRAPSLHSLYYVVPYVLNVLDERRCAFSLEPLVSIKRTIDFTIYQKNQTYANYMCWAGKSTREI